MSADSLDNQDLLSALILDLYDAENIGNLVNVQLKSGAQANYTWTTTSYVANGNAGAFVPTKPNAAVKLFSVLLQSSGAATGTLQVRLDGVAGTQDKPAIINSSAQREMVAMAVFTGLTVGDSYNIDFYGKVTTGTLTMNNSVANHVVEITEWD